MFDDFGVGLGSFLDGFGKNFVDSPGVLPQQPAPQTVAMAETPQAAPAAQAPPAQPPAAKPPVLEAPKAASPPAQVSAGGDYGSYLQDITKKYGLPGDYLARTAKIESNFNNNDVSSTGAAGIFQFTKGTAKNMGLDNRFDPYASADAAARLAVDNRNTLAKTLGRDPTAGELYLAHQQGKSGASALLSNPDMNAVDALTPAYGGNRAAAARAITVNGGTTKMTAGQFASRWTAKFDGSTQVASVPNISVGGRESSAAPSRVASVATTDQPSASGDTAQAPGLGIGGMPRKAISFNAPGIKQPAVPKLQQAAVRAPNIVQNSPVIANSDPLPMNWQA